MHTALSRDLAHIGRTDSFFFIHRYIHCLWLTRHTVQTGIFSQPKKKTNSFYLGLIRSTKETLIQQDVSAEGSSIIQRPGWEKSKQPALQSTKGPHEAALISPMFRDNIMRLLTPFFFQTGCAKTHSSGHQVFVRWQKEKGRTTPKLVTAAPARCPSRRP